MMLRTICILVSIGVFQQVLCQKQEVEKRIQSEEVPSDAVEWINQIKVKKKRLKWYFEETSGKKSYEAKFIHNHHLHSVEFDTLGTVEDIEVLVNKSKLKKPVLDSIEFDLDEVFDKYHIVKIQVQYTSSDDQYLLSWMNGGSNKLTTQYEIEFEAKKDGVWRMYEGTFDAAGNLLDKREIIIRSTENLNY